MTGSSVQVEVSCSIGRLYVGKMMTDGHSCVLLAFQGLVYTGVSERSGQVSWYNGCRREIQMSIDNLIEEAQFQVVSSAGKGGQVA